MLGIGASARDRHAGIGWCDDRRDGLALSRTLAGRAFDRRLAQLARRASGVESSQRRARLRTRTSRKSHLPDPVGTSMSSASSYAFAANRPPVIRNPSFSLPVGQSLGVIGASASGKTTLLRLLLGIWRPQSGAVRLDGADVAHWDRNALGRHIGYVPQDVELFAGTVGQNIARLSTANDAGDVGSNRACRAARACPRNDSAIAGRL